MSNIEALGTIAITDLAQVHGGDNSHPQHTEDTTVHVPGVRITQRTQRSDYEMCLAANQRQAREAIPDSRNWWDYLTGGVDRNARARADYERRGMANCAPVRGG